MSRALIMSATRLENSNAAGRHRTSIPRSDAALTFCVSSWGSLHVMYASFYASTLVSPGSVCHLMPRAGPHALDQSFRDVPQHPRPDVIRSPLPGICGLDVQLADMPESCHILSGSVSTAYSSFAVSRACIRQPRRTGSIDRPYLPIPLP